MTHYTCLQMTLLHSAKSYIVKICLIVAYSLLCVSIKVNFSPFLTIICFKTFDRLFFTLSRKHFNDASGFPVIMSSLCFTNSESKWARNPVVPVFGATCLKLKFGRLQTDVLSLGLRIHNCRSRDRCSDLLKVPKISSRGSFQISRSSFFCKNFMGEWC